MKNISNYINEVYKKEWSDMYYEGIDEEIMNKYKKEFDNCVEFYRKNKNKLFSADAAKYDGSKDMIGQPLKEGDLIYINSISEREVGVYIGYKGKTVYYLSPANVIKFKTYDLPEGCQPSPVDSYWILKIDSLNDIKL